MKNLVLGTVLILSLGASSRALASIFDESSASAYTTTVDPSCTNDSGGHTWSGDDICSQDKKVQTQAVVQAALNGEISQEQAVELIEQINNN